MEPAADSLGLILAQPLLYGTSLPLHALAKPACTLCPRIPVPLCTVTPSQSHHSCPNWAKLGASELVCKEGSPPRVAVVEVGAHAFLPLSASTVTLSLPSVCLCLTSFSQEVSSDSLQGLRTPITPSILPSSGFDNDDLCLLWLETQHMKTAGGM